MMLRLLRVVEEERGANPQLQVAFKDFIQLAASAPLQDTPTPAILCLCCHPSPAPLAAAAASLARSGIVSG